MKTWLCSLAGVTQWSGVGLGGSLLGISLRSLLCLMRGRAATAGALHYLEPYTVRSVASVHKRVTLLASQGSIGVALALAGSR